MESSKTGAWQIHEEKFDITALGKCEAIMAQGNGYLGMRAATEEAYLGETRDYFVAGTFHTFDEQEVTELPNAADITRLELTLDGEVFSMLSGTVKAYSRVLNLKNGELHRHVSWISPRGKYYKLDFYRMVSMAELHVSAMKVVVQAEGKVGQTVKLKVRTGIDGRMSNSGSQHFSDGTKRLYEQKIMQLQQQTTGDGLEFVHNAVVQLSQAVSEEQPRVTLERRRIYCDYEAEIRTGTACMIEKISNVYTSRDKDHGELNGDKLIELSLETLKHTAPAGYDKLLEASATAWKEKVWEQAPISLQSECEEDLRAIHFAQYHLAVMTPAHDNRMSIGAKGLSGEGYKGHTFWDTEIFILPYYLFMMPKLARALLEYRYQSLEGARKKAKDNHYQGAQYPWESAWLNDGEVTPLWGVANVETGERTRIWSGMKEQHITADVAYAVWQYYQATGDDAFMEQCGYEILFETADFYASRLDYDKQDGQYHIYDVIGPDEYKEHVDDNAFTNYMAYWNMRQALHCYSWLLEHKTQVWDRLDQKLELKKRCVYHIWDERSSHMYLPQPDKCGIIPQDSTYRTYPDIDLTKYKHQEQIGSILLDYSIDQVSHMQVSKQADILMTFFLQEGSFSKAVKEANWKYYEARTLHDSSLSLSTHCVLACDSGDNRLAYELYKKSCEIDMGEALHSSDEGIHAASIGGIWQCVVYGFGGVRMVSGKLRIEPLLPDAWKVLEYKLTWQDQRLRIKVTHNHMQVQNLTGTRQVEFWHKGVNYPLEEREVCSVVLKEDKKC